MSGLRRPLVLPRPTYYDSTSDYHSIDDSLNRVEYFSNAVLEDQYDAALRSRGRDDALLRNANATIEGVYYRPVVSTSGLHASRPPMMTSNLSAAGHQQAIKDSEAVIAASNASNNASSAEDAKNMGGTVNIPRYYACGGDPLNRPVTELRRKMRRMVAQGKRNPNYYRMGLDD